MSRGSHYAWAADGSVRVCHCGPANLYHGPRYVTLRDHAAVTAWIAAHRT